VTDLYAVLGIERTATTADVRKAYRRMAKKAHPDAGGSDKQFALIRLAHDVLTDPARRQKYDETGNIELKPVDNALGEALQQVKIALDHVITVCLQRRMEPETVDVIADATRYLRDKIAEGEQANAKTKHEMDKGRKFVKRFKGKKKKPNLITPLFEQQFAQGDQIIANNNRSIASMKRAIEILKDHEFDWSAAETSYASPMMAAISRW